MQETTTPQAIFELADLPGEEWRAVPGYESLYSISNLGRVKSHGRISVHSNGRKCTCHPRIMRPAPSKKSGYWSLRLSGLHEIDTWYVHHLVLTAFVCPMPEGMEACHGDGDRSNNRLDNLRWDTRPGNLADKVQHGTHNKGERHNFAKLTDALVIEMRKRREDGISYAALGKEFGVTTMTAYRAVSGQSWSHIKQENTGK